MSTESRPPTEGELGMRLNEAGVWLSQDGNWEWNGAGWLPRYVGVGGVERKLYKSVGERVPVGMYCRAYYAYGSRRLLSVETAPSVDAYAFVSASKTWARIRWAGIVAIVGVFLLVVGAAYVVTGDPSRRNDTSVAGVLLLSVGGVLLGATIWRLIRQGRGGSTS